MDVIGIEMRGDDHLIFRAPHLSRGFNANLMRFLGSNLALGKALISVVGDILTALTETALDGNHFVISVMLGAVNTRDKCRMIGLVIVLHIANGGIQIFIKIFFGGGFVRIVGVVDYFL